MRTRRQEGAVQGLRETEMDPSRWVSLWLGGASAHLPWPEASCDCSNISKLTAQF